MGYVVFDCFFVLVRRLLLRTEQRRRVWTRASGELR